MTCEEATERLDDYVDGTLTEAERHGVELHLAACAGCAEEERRLRALLARVAAMPREMSPSRDLWPGIAERIAAVRPRAAAPVARRIWSWSPSLLAAAAAVVVALGAGLARVWPPAAGRETATGAVHEAAWTTDPALLAAEREYARATAQLMAALEARKASLPPETMAAVEKDLTTIDAALRQVRGALRQDPANAQLSHMLASTHQKKLDVLQRVVRLSTQT
jgi:predicted anti-sigma-YlaC factor YlaD